MAEITLNGKLFHAGIGNDPIVILSVFDEGPFEDWCRQNQVFTQIFRHRDPASGNERASIYVTEGAIEGIPEGSTVSITVDLRNEKRGNGLRVVIVTPEDRNKP